MDQAMIYSQDTDTRHSIDGTLNFGVLHGWCIGKSSKMCPSIHHSVFSAEYRIFGAKGWEM